MKWWPGPTNMAKPSHLANEDKKHTHKEQALHNQHRSIGVYEDTAAPYLQEATPFGVLMLGSNGGL